MILKNGKRLDGMGDSMPIGSVIEYNGTDIPDGWEVLPGDANVYIGTNKPTDGQEIWVYKSDNILPMEIFSTSENGMTFTNNGDGTFNLSGTATAEANFAIDYVLNEEVKINSGVTHTLAVNKNNGSQPFQVHVAFFDEGGTWITTPMVCSDLSTTKVLTVPSNAYTLHLLIRVNAGYTINLDNISIQLQEGEKVDTFLPYSAPKIMVKTESGYYNDLIPEYYNTPDNIYSTAERRVGTWVDGRPVYKKTLVIDFSNKKQFTILNNITKIQIRKFNGWIIKEAGFEYPLPYYIDDGDKAVIFRSSNKEHLDVILGDTMSGSIRAVIEYTKTID